MDRTPQWLAIVREQRSQRGDGIGAIAALAPAGATLGPWREAQTPFMQQAAGLNRSMRELHALLLAQFADYVDMARVLPSKVSSMTDAERDAMDAEAAALTGSFAQGVDALRMLVRQRHAQRQVQADEDSDDEAFGGAPAAAVALADAVTAHQSVCVTFLMERLRAVAALIETMQAERCRNAKEERRGLLEAALAAGAQLGGAPAPPPVALQQMLGPTPEEAAEDAAFAAMFDDAALASEETGWEESNGGSGGGLSGRSAAHSGGGGGGVAGGSSGAAAAAAASTADASCAELAGTSPGVACPPPTRVSLQSGGSAAAARQGGGAAAAAQGEAAAAAAAEEDGDRGVGSLARENAELLEQLKSELDGARQVEVKMAEISGLMSLFATRVAEQQEEMEAIYSAAMDAHDSLRRGGAHLGKAQQRGLAARKYYVAFMTVMTLLLLFLHLIAP